ncbi:MAG: SDR family oxidoreductase [Acidisphaera sp.]|nr:SDR family oxidoreductase [Acidisphaera sp.]
MATKQPVLIVTGGSQGIGAEIARLAASRGYAVCLSYGHAAEPAQALVGEIEAAGGRAIAVKADAGNEDDVVRLFRQAESALGPISALVNNAGITGPFATVDRITSEIIDEVMGVNVRGVFLATREAVLRMATDLGGAGGAIVNVSSRASGLGGAGEWVHYAASKGAVDTLTLGAARELAPRGIRVNAVNPGLIDTPLHAKAGAPDRVVRLSAGVPLGRPGTAAEVATVVLWLLSDEASYVTGALLPVSGGR